MFALYLLCLTQLCLLPIFVQSFPQATLERLMTEYSEGLTDLKNHAKEPHHHKEVKDLVPNVSEAEIVDDGKAEKNVQHFSFHLSK